MNLAEQYEAKRVEFDAKEREKGWKEAPDEASSYRVFFSQAGGFGVSDPDRPEH